MNIRHLHSLVLAAGALLISVDIMAQSLDDIISNERARQIARQVSTNISNRVSLDISDSSNLTQNPMGGSSDSISLTPDAGWATLSYTEISDDNLASFDADIYQTTFGIDKRIDDFYFGLSGTYAYTETEIGGVYTQGHTHSVSATPYLAYVFNKNVFLNLLTGYSYSKSEPDFNGFNFDSESDEYNAELTLNGVKVIDNWMFKGRAGARYRHTDTYFENPVSQPADNDQDTWTYLVSSEAGYAFANGFRAYAGALYEYNVTEDGEDDGVLYMSTGVDYSISDKFTVGVSYATDANNEDVDIHTVGMNVRLSM